MILDGHLPPRLPAVPARRHSAAETGNVLTRSPPSRRPTRRAIVAHVSQHIAAVTHAYESKIFNPPTTKS